MRNLMIRIFKIYNSVIIIMIQEMVKIGGRKDSNNISGRRSIII